MNKILKFKDKEIRTVNKNDGLGWFVGVDILKILGFEGGVAAFPWTGWQLSLEYANYPTSDDRG